QFSPQLTTEHDGVMWVGGGILLPMYTPLDTIQYVVEDQGPHPCNSTTEIATHSARQPTQMFTSMLGNYFKMKVVVINKS
ncbi:hypothetical protein, partial [Salmonella sp. s55962]|uniref:hypothetical protein n=1 Tax=Salmonella sp. s55962 TaxID=3159685 RepID=UPI00397FF75A